MHTAVSFFFHSAVQKLLIYLTSTYFFFCFELPASLVQSTVTLHSWSRNSEPLWKDFRSFSLSFREAHGCAQERKKEVSRTSASAFNEERWEMEFHLKVKDVRAELLLSIWCRKHSCCSQLDELKLPGQIIKQWNMSLAQLLFEGHFIYFSVCSLQMSLQKSTVQVYSWKTQAICHN